MSAPDNAAACECGAVRGCDCACGKARERLRERLDRPTPWREVCGAVDCECARAAWRAWFSGDEYLGEVSARTGPDDVGAAQRCGCAQCRGELGDR